MKYIVLILLFAASSVQAQPLPQSEWTSISKLWLTRALVGEAGWLPTYERNEKGKVRHCEGDDCFSNRDWRIIPHVLLKRWKRMRLSCVLRGYACSAPGTPMSFVAVARKYCSPLKSHLAGSRFERENSGNPVALQAMHRRRFIQAVAWDGSNLGPLADRYSKHTRGRVRVDMYRTGWFAARRVVEMWGVGEVDDPCLEAEHWNNVPPRRSSLYVVDCGETLNFYSAVVRKEKPDERSGEQRMGPVEVSKAEVHGDGKEPG